MKTRIFNALEGEGYLPEVAKILNSELKEKTPLEKNIDKIGKVLTFLTGCLQLIRREIYPSFTKQIKELCDLYEALNNIGEANHDLNILISK